jgi:hypothetical protein
MQYLRKAEGFKSRIKGARKTELPEGRVRYTKDGLYIILFKETGEIISFGQENTDGY